MNDCATEGALYDDWGSVMEYSATEGARHVNRGVG